MADIERVDETVQQRLSGHLLRDGDIVFGRKGAVDRHVRVRAAEAGWMQGSDCIRVRLKADGPVSPEFFSKALLTPRHKSWMEAQCSHGATMASLNQEILRRIVISVPDRTAQMRIVGLLSAFDELIEINEKRVELLENLARSLYRESFVYFRFPGHERVELVDSEIGPIPEGWGVKPFTEVAEFLNGFAFKPLHWGEFGRAIIKIRELKQGVTEGTPRYSGNDVPAKYFVEPGDLLFSWSADLGVYLWSGEPGLLNQHLFTVKPRSSLSLSFLFHALDAAMRRFDERALGTTMRHIKRSALDEVKCLVPPDELVRRFDADVSPLDAQALSLRSEARTCAATRDLLLSRLVTGRLDISDIDLGELLPSSVA